MEQVEATRRPPLTCQRGIEVLKLQDLVGALAARQAVVVHLKVVRDGLLHVAGAAAEVPVVVERHALEEERLRDDREDSQRGFDLRNQEDDCVNRRTSYGFSSWSMRYSSTSNSVL